MQKLDYIQNLTHHLVLWYYDNILMPMNKSHNFSRSTYYIFIIVSLLPGGNYLFNLLLIIQTIPGQDSSTVKIAELYCDWLKRKLMDTTKGQLISKFLFVIFNSFKKQTWTL